MAEESKNAPSGEVLDLNKVNRLLVTGLANGASDIHFRVGEPPLYRVDGALKELKFRKLEPGDTKMIAGEVLKRGNKLQLDEVNEFDSTYIIPGKGQFRTNIYKQLGNFAVILRVIPFEIPGFQKLRLPQAVSKIAGEERGLILVTGATGMGKSTTIACMMEHINQNKKRHVLTIEDPVEFLHQNKKSSFSQREVGTDTTSFQVALRSALRQDPDVIFVGEMRDKETMEIVLRAAETGHLVFSTVHTPDAANTIGRIIGSFPQDEQTLVRMRLAECLRAIISQRLLPMKDGKGRIVACEILVNSKAISESIRNPEKTHEIPQYMEKGDQYGMQTFDQHLMTLFKAGKINLKDAKEAASNPADFERNLTFE